MCGIAGWVDFDRDLTRERDIAQAMTETMKARGPDAEGLWISQHAALGHRRLSIIDLEGGRQPMIADENGAPLAVLIYTGEAYNFRELRAELETRGHRFRTQSDTEVVLRAYVEWGAAFPQRLNGMYAFAIWDVRRQELLLVRDRMGVKPLYYYPTPSGVLFGSEPKAILANPLARREVDAEGLCELLGFIKTPGLAIFRGMREVRPGHVVVVNRQGLREQRYWGLEARPHTDDLQTTIKTIRGLLEDIVARQLISDVPLCTLLSGGLDSSAITALAQKALRAQNAGPVRSFAVDFVGHAENFKADELRDTPDAPFVADVARLVETEHSNIVLSSAELADPAVRSTVLRARDLPFGLGDMDTSLLLLFQAVRKHSTVALSGESADEVFGGYSWFHDPAVVGAPMFPWHGIALKMMRGLEAGRLPTLLDPGLLQRLELQRYIADRYQQALAEVPRLEGETGLERRMREVCYLHLTQFVQILLDRKDRMSMATGLEVRVPFCDHRLVEYVFNTPWAMKTFDGREKSLLRAATADVLPPSVVARRKSPYPSTQDPKYTQALREDLGRYLADGKSPVMPFIDVERARSVAKESGGASDEITRRMIDQVLQLGRWLERYEVQVRV